MEIEKAKCLKCNMDKPLDEFYKCSQTRSGLQHTCKTCTNERINAYKRTPERRAKFNVSHRIYVANRKANDPVFAAKTKADGRMRRFNYLEKHKDDPEIAARTARLTEGVNGNSKKKK